MNTETDLPFSDRVLNELLPEDLDWQTKVRSYPIPAMILAAAVGFFLGRARGIFLFSSVSDFAVDEVTKNITGALDRRAGEDR